MTGTNRWIVDCPARLGLGVLWGMLAVAVVPASAERLEFAAIGNLPFEPPRQSRSFENLVSVVNRSSPAFTVHVGDFKDGQSLCAVDYYRVMKSAFQSFSHPLIYTPGDNEWTDCHRPECGNYDPLERLSVLRNTFFTLERSLGQRSLPLDSQRGVGRFSKFVENVRWQSAGVVFATLHVVGSNNNYRVGDAAALAEFAEREAANLNWMEAAFTQAKRTRAPAVVLFMHASIFPESADAELSPAYAELTRALERHAVAFAKPILVVHGDSRRFRIDKPLRAEEGGQLVANVTRLEVFGAPENHAVSVKIDTASRTIFSFSPLVVDENL